MNVLSNDTRKIIDDARDTLVGQIPVPMMQCQQITLALTYKFMSDDDQRAERLGGERHYFAGDLEPYGWDKLMSLRLDDTQRSELYRAGLGVLQESDSMPAVFREIFKDAVVPFGDHRTLALFLSTMDRMVYDDSEKLGDAYEYLLKTAEAQADAGQFRTPRHIIDFIVKIINPQKHEVIIDPACGTAGFLVSAYQHVKSQHELAGWPDLAVRSGLHSFGRQPEGLRHLARDDEVGHGQHVPAHAGQEPQHRQLRHADEHRPLERVRRRHVGEPAVHDAQGWYPATQLGSAFPPSGRKCCSWTTSPLT